MSKNSILLVSGLVALSLVVSLLALNNSKKQVAPVKTDLGALTGPDIPSQYLQWGGVEEYRYSAAFNNASTTLCSITTPAATSTLQFASVDITTGTTTVLTVEVAKGAKNSEATTTLLGTKSLVPTTERQTIIASTTPGSAVIFAPNERLNVKFGSASALTATANSIGGNCKATFIRN